MDGPPRSEPAAVVPTPDIFDNDDVEAVDEGRPIGDSVENDDVGRRALLLLCCLLLLAAAA